jgi:hypothetical protein
MGLEGIWARVALALNGGKQGGYNLREAMRGGRGGSRGSLGAVCCYLCFRACCGGEAWMRR